MNMQALFDRIGVPSLMMDVYMEQSQTLSIEFLARMDENNAVEKKDLIDLGFNSLTARIMIIVSKEIKGI